jgi:hypothetical protein
MIIFVDIDGTICKTEGNDYLNAKPDYTAIAKINKLWEEGNTVIYWTARGGTSGKNWRSETIDQLRAWGCQCDDVRVGKPSFDQFIDDKACSAKVFFIDETDLANKLYQWSDWNLEADVTKKDCRNIVNWILKEIR